MAKEKTEVNVEEIMEEIRIKARAREVADTMPPFSAVPIGGDAPKSWGAPEGKVSGWDEFTESLSRANMQYDVRYYWDFGPGMKSFAKRVVRKLNKCLLLPIVDKLREYNALVVRCLNYIRTFIEEQRRLNDENREEHQRFREQLDNQKKSIAALEEEQYQAQAYIRELQDTTSRYAAELREVQDKADRYINALIEVQDKIGILEREGAFIGSARDEEAVKMSTSQSGEDMILWYIIRTLNRDPAQEIYLDLGANRSKIDSNTYYLYKQGARGVLVEANPALIGELKFYRSGDVVLNRCVSDVSGETVKFYVVTGTGLSTPDKEKAEATLAENPNLHIENTVSVETITVQEILETYFDKAPTIVNVDIEGKEMDILKSFDFTRYRPLIMIIETIPYRNHLVVGEKEQDVVAFMQSQNYIEYCFTGINSIFLDLEQVKDCLPQSRLEK